MRSQEITALFCNVDVVGTTAVAAAYSLPEAYIRSAGDEIGVARIGNAQAWVEADVEELEEILEEEAETEDEEEEPSSDPDPEFDEEDLEDE